MYIAHAGEEMDSNTNLCLGQQTILNFQRRWKTEDNLCLGQSHSICTDGDPHCLIYPATQQLPTCFAPEPTERVQSLIETGDIEQQEPWVSPAAISNDGQIAAESTPNQCITSYPSEMVPLFPEVPGNHAKSSGMRLCKLMETHLRLQHRYFAFRERHDSHISASISCQQGTKLAKPMLKGGLHISPKPAILHRKPRITHWIGPKDLDVLDVRTSTRDDKHDIVHGTRTLRYHSAHILGRKSIDWWKKTAGRSKSWNQIPDTVSSAPLNFLRSQHIWESPLLEGVGITLGSPCRSLHHRIKSTQHGSQNARGAGADVCVDDTIPSPETKHTATEVRNESTPNVEPPVGFIRLVWGDKSSVGCKQELDKFLPTGLTFKSGWRIEAFSRNDRHADVYSVRHTRRVQSPVQYNVIIEAHFFLEYYHGNSEAFARRQKQRMRKSGNCLESFWYNGRHVFIMRVPQHLRCLNLQDFGKDFPALAAQKNDNLLGPTQTNSTSYARTYAEVVAQKPLQPCADPKTPPSLLHDAINISAEIGQISQITLNKAERQRRKRQKQRQERREIGRAEAPEKPKATRNPTGVLCGHQ